MLRSCSTEISRDAGMLHQRIALQWNGAGDTERVLGLGIPDPPSLRVRVLRGAPANASASDPVIAGGELLLDLQPGTPAADRAAPGPQLAVALRLSPGLNLIDIVGRLRGDPLHMPDTTLYTPAGWHAWQALHSFLAGSVLGLLLMLLVGLGLMVWLGRDSSHLAYAGLALCYCLAVLQVQGFLRPLVGPGTAVDSQRWLPWLAVAGCLCQGAFAISFLQLRQRQPWGCRVLIAAMALLLLPLLLPQAQADRLLQPMFALYIVALLWIAYWALRTGLPGAGWYAAGTASFALCDMLLFALGANGLNPLPAIYFFDYVKLGYLLEMGCFCAAQVQRLLDLLRDRQAMRQRQLDDARSLLRTTQAMQQAHADASSSRLLLASTSHDLAQPLSALRMTVGALRHQASPDPAMFHQLDQALLHAQSLLHCVLDQARNQHQQAAEDEQVMLGELLAQVAQRHQAGAQAKGLRLSWVDSAQAHRAPAMVLHRVLDNLVANAVRYTQRGRIVLGVRLRQGALELQVLDTGQGIPAASIAALQRPFEQQQPEAAQGHGLGLYIVRSLCHEFGFELRVQSTPGRGSRFGVVLPKPVA